MKIGIDLNDVVRDFSNNFVRYYCEGYNRNFKLDDLEFFSNDLSLVFPFKSDSAYQKFVYQDFDWELFAKCPLCTKELGVELNNWVNKTITELDIDEQVEVMFVSPMEMGQTIGDTLFFLSKIATKVREFYFPTDSLTIWDKCDAVITANPRLLENKPENKVSIKIKAEYNTECDADFTFSTLSKFINESENIIKVIEKKNELDGLQDND